MYFQGIVPPVSMWARAPSLVRQGHEPCTGEDARAYIVSARDRPNLIAYWEEIPAKHECACIADVDSGQLCHPAKARPAEAISPGADAGASVSLQPGLRRLRQDSVPGPCAQAPADPRGVLPGGR